MGARLAEKNDKYLQSGAENEIYSDFLHTFIPHPNTGQITRKTNVDSVKMSLRNLLLTNKYERLRNPRFGGNIRRWLFEQFIPTTYIEIENEIRTMVENYEPRVNLIDVIVTPNEEQNMIAVDITFNVITSANIEKLELSLYRIR